MKEDDLMSWSSEALKLGILPSKLESDMTEQDWFEFRNQLDPDIMEFDGIEGYIDDEFINITSDENISSSISNASINIQTNLTTRNYTNGSSTSRIKYIVIHYTANNGDTAWGNTNYFKSTYRGASAHYFVDENSIWRCVEDKNISWHCGGGLQGSNGHSFYKICTNSNSIGIEMCSRKYANGTYYFKEQTINNCIWLVKYLMNTYGIDVNHIIRHYDVTGKICPEPLVRDESQWNNFKNKLIEVEKPQHWAKIYLDALISKGVITDKNQWSDFNSPINKALTIALLDKLTGGTWGSNEANSSIHWAQPMVISLCGKGVIYDSSQWISTLDVSISKALLLALVCNLTGGVSDLYKNRIPDHWARNCLDSLCDRGVINTPSSWTDFEAEVSKGQTMALLYKAIYK